MRENNDYYSFLENIIVRNKVVVWSSHGLSKLSTDAIASLSIVILRFLDACLFAVGGGNADLWLWLDQNYTVQCVKSARADTNACILSDIKEF